jgi:hypothetical protein
MVGLMNGYNTIFYLVLPMYCTSRFAPFGSATVMLVVGAVILYFMSESA